MARKSQPVKKPTAKQTAAQKRQTQNRREIWALVCIFLAIFSIICCFNTTAFLIRPFASLIAGLFGQSGRYILPLALIATVVILFTSRGKPVRLRIVSVFTLILTVSAVYHLIQGEALVWEWKVVPALFKGGIAGTTGGLLGGLLAMLLKTGITVVGAYIVLILVMLVQIITIMNMTVNSIITAIKNRPRLQKPDEEPEPEQDTAERIVNHVANRHIARVEKRRAAEFDLPVDDPPLEKAEKRKKKSRVPSPDEYLEKQQEERPAARPVSVTCDDVPEEPLHAAEHPVTVVPEAALPEEPVPEPAFEPVPVQELPEEPEDRPEPAAEQEPAAPWDEAPAPQHDEPAVRPAPAKQEDAEELVIPQPEQSGQAEYVFPPVSLLTPRREGSVDATSEMRENSQRLADTLKSFGIEPHIVDVIRGPSVTRYELELDRGVKLSKITNLADDIALALGAAGVRISAIPDKVSVVGIEVPNKIVNTVYAREVIDSPAFRSSKSKISFAVGKDISGNCIVGDIAKLPEICALAKQYGARVMVDDAHGLGVLGEGGRGTASYFGLEDQVDVYMGTFSKSLASLGGYMAASEEVADFVRHASRPFIFSASIPPANCATALAALRHLEQHPELPERLRELSLYARKGMTDRGMKIRESALTAPTPIIPIYTYETYHTLEVAREIYDRGVYVNPTLPPATPEGEALLRTSYMATHTEALLDEAMDIMADVLVKDHE